MSCCGSCGGQEIEPVTDETKETEEIQNKVQSKDEEQDSQNNIG